jgi:hypothetical protein
MDLWTSRTALWYRSTCSDCCRGRETVYGVSLFLAFMQTHQQVMPSFFDFISTRLRDFESRRLWVEVKGKSPHTKKKKHPARVAGVPSWPSPTYSSSLHAKSHTPMKSSLRLPLPEAPAPSPQVQMQVRKDLHLIPLTSLPYLPSSLLRIRTITR